MSSAETTAKPNIWWRALVGATSGPLLALAFPTLSWWPLLAIGFVPLLWAIDGLSPWRRGLIGFLAGLGLHAGMTYWVGDAVAQLSGVSRGMGWAVTAGFCVFSALNVTLFALFAPPLKRICGRWSLLVVPALWCGIEFSFPLIFPWQIGNGLYRVLALIQIADLTGVYGLSFLVLCCNCALLELVRSGPRRAGWSMAIAASLVFATVMYGQWRLGALQAPSETRTILLVQPNLRAASADPLTEAQRARFFRVLVKLTNAALAKQRPDLMIWPEGAFPWTLKALCATEKGRVPAAAERLFSAVRHWGVPLITGVVTESGWNRHNSAVVIHPDGRRRCYHKRRLVPFAEMAPFAGRFPWWTRIFGAWRHYTPGSAQVRFHVAGVELVPSICYEATFPRHVQASLTQRSGVLINLTSDEWFGDTKAPHLHLMVQQLRAVENRIPLVRVTNTGISALIAPSGRIAQATGLFVPALRYVRVSVTPRSSVYRRHGDWFLLLLALIVFWRVSAGVYQKWRLSRARAAGNGVDKAQ